VIEVRNEISEKDRLNKMKHNLVLRHVFKHRIDRPVVIIETKHDMFCYGNW